MKEEFVAFVRSTFKQKEGLIPLHEPRFIGNERNYVMETIDSTFVSSVGKFVDRFEEQMCEITGAKHAIAIVNGTNALHLSLLLAGVEPNNEVITQPLSFIATANAISYCHAVPYFLDVDKETLGLSPQKVKEHLELVAELRNGVCYNKESGRKIAACVPMHTFGLPMYIDELIEICNAYNIPVVEDAAESMGSFYKEKHTGTFGLLGAFSLNGNKTITSGGGGAIITNDTALAKKAKHLSTQAKIAHKWEYNHDAIGYNYRMPNINAALACAQLEQLEQFIVNKRELHNLYQSFFNNYNTVELVKEIPQATANYWLNAIVLENKQKRDDFLTFTNDNGIMTRPIWNLLSNLPMFEYLPKGNLSNAQWLEERVVNITSSVRI